VTPSRRRRRSKLCHPSWRKQ